jgi:two-component system, NtrC family, nitrogen regulation response regulator GlnG
MTTRTVLIADDDSAIRTVLSQALSRAGFNVRATGTASALWRWVSEGEGDVVITDVILPDENAFDVLPRIKKMRPLLPVVVMSAQNTIVTAIRAAELGAYDYLPKPFDLSALVQTVTKALDQSSKTARNRPVVQGEALPIIGRSNAMQDIYRLIARLTQTDLTVTIVGESGTGKELVAKALHDFSKRRKGPFVALNMAAIPRELIESELFGHEKGSFTGAGSRMAGRFEQAEGGSLFLDEIGDMPLEAQTRLLRVLQQGEYTTVGGSTPIKTNVRIICATHRDLRQLIGQGLFREDLFYRLNVVPLRLPPLRERTEDVPDLVRHFLDIALKEGLPRKDISQDAMNRLMTHRWPGNVRELENLVKRLLAMEVDDVIPLAAVERELAVVQGFVEKQAASTDSLPEFMEAHLGRYFASFGKGMPPEGLYELILSEIEPALLRASLAATRGNQLRAADLLGINRNTLRSKLKERNITSIRGFSVSSYEGG